jgi:hypothetical protein
MRALLVVTFVLLSACQERQEPATSTAEAELAAARALWLLHGTNNYVFTRKMSCWCGSSEYQPIEVVVRDGTIVVPKSFGTYEIKTIPEYFDLVASLLKSRVSGGRDIQVVYDSIDGHPRHIDTMGFNTTAAPPKSDADGYTLDILLFRHNAESQAESEARSASVVP